MIRSPKRKNSKIITSIPWFKIHIDPSQEGCEVVNVDADRDRRTIRTLCRRGERAHSLLFIQIFAGNIILRHLVRANFLLISVPSVFHARHYVGLERVSFLEQLVDTLRIRTLDAGQPLQISRLPTRPRERFLREECHRIYALAFFPNLFLNYTHHLGDCLLADRLLFYRHPFQSCFLLRQLRSGSFPIHCRLLLSRFLHSHPLIANSSLGFRLPLLSFLFSNHRRSLPPTHVPTNRAGCIANTRHHGRFNSNTRGSGFSSPSNQDQ